MDNRDGLLSAPRHRLRARHSAPPAAAPAQPASNRLPGVDGLRAFAALWVVLFHMRAFSGGPVWPGVDLLLRSGSTGVSLFLVLSGFCLYLPYAGGRLDRFRTFAFLRRRCTRLLPAYYTSLAIVIVAHIAGGGLPGLPRMGGAELAGQAVTHATLTHQFAPATFYALNGAYWSLGLEWELYLTLPLLILAVRRFGLKWTVTAVFAVTIGYRLGLWLAVWSGLLSAQGPWAGAVLPNFILGRWSEFALGMVAAELYRQGRAGQGAGRLRVAAVIAAAAGLLLADNPLKHVLFGVVFFALLCAVLAGDNVVARVFSWRPLVAVGVMSYSLYLVHQPIVGLLAHALGGGTGADPRRVFLEQVALLPVLLLVAFALFATVEWRSIARGSGRARGRVRDLLFPPAPAGAVPAGAVATAPGAPPRHAAPVLRPQPALPAEPGG
jgi:peptidoglycan/LPS O-acetylase OafA/YrhL